MPSTSSRVTASVVDVVHACHPVPAAAVTGFAAALAGAAAPRGRRNAAALRIATAVGLGQLATGWANDAVDAPLDAAAGRTDKPVAAGRLRRSAVAALAVAAAAAAVPASLALDRAAPAPASRAPRPGRLHLAVLAAALGYDLGLKRTPASPLPYLAFFGALPAVAAGAAGRPAPRLLCVAAALLGLAGHLANTVPDAEADAATGVRGLPQLLGPRASRVGAALGVAAADVVLLGGRRRELGPLPRAVLLAAGALGAAGAAADGRTGFRAVMGAAGLSVAGVVVDVAAGRAALLR